jgi:phage FluMu protein gp41
MAIANIGTVAAITAVDTTEAATTGADITAVGIMVGDTMAVDITVAGIVAERAVQSSAARLQETKYGPDALSAPGPQSRGYTLMTRRFALAQSAQRPRRLTARA